MSKNIKLALILLVIMQVLLFFYVFTGFLMFYYALHELFELYSNEVVLITCIIVVTLAFICYVIANCGIISLRKFIIDEFRG